MQRNDNTFTNNFGMSNNSMNLQETNRYSDLFPQSMPMMDKTLNQMVYPEIFYKLQPYIMLVCDQMDMFSPLMPTREMVENMTDSIYDEVCRMYPDIAEYTRDHEKSAKDESSEAAVVRQFGMFDGGPWFRPNFRRRGLFRDLIDILLLSELTRRRRRFY